MPDAQELGRDYFQPEELAELRHRAGPDSLATMLLCGWTRKEACLKALGTGLSLSPLCFATGLVPDARQVLMPSDAGPLAIDVVSLDLGSHLLAAVAAMSAPGKA